MIKSCGLDKGFTFMTPFCLNVFYYLLKDCVDARVLCLLALQERESKLVLITGTSRKSILVKISSVFY